MNFKKSLGIVGFTAVVQLGTLSVGAYAQDALTSTGSQQTAPAADSDLTARVKKALHSDPALYDKHIDVSMEKGKVVLRGFVSSAQDLQKAVRAATGAAGDRKVVNNLTIKEGGDGGSG
jgi:hyperosmotically inducible periplasmic protein